MEPRLSLITLGVADVRPRARLLRGAGVQSRQRLAGERRVPRCRRRGACPVRPRRVGRGRRRRRQRARFLRGRARPQRPQRSRVDKALAEAVAAGAKLIKPAGKTFWGGYSGYFADPDGHLWEVAHNPYFTLDAEGRVVLDM